jgi:hypothetical protein
MRRAASETKDIEQIIDVLHVQENDVLLIQPTRRLRRDESQYLSEQWSELINSFKLKCFVVIMDEPYKLSVLRESSEWSLP